MGEEKQEDEYALIWNGVFSLSLMDTCIKKNDT